MKLITLSAVLATALMTTTAQAQSFGGIGGFGGGFSSFGGDDIQGCGPTVALNLSDSKSGSGGYGASSGTSVQASIQWQLGRKKSCEQSNKSKLRQARYKSQQQEIALLNQKIDVCKKFSASTAPASMVRFCGDLLGVQMDNSVVAQGIRPTYQSLSIDN